MKEPKVGDLVDFCSLFFGATSGKKRPGILLEIEDETEENILYSTFPKSFCKVLWANGRITNENFSALIKYDDVTTYLHNG